MKIYRLAVHYAQKAKPSLGEGFVVKSSHAIDSSQSQLVATPCTCVEVLQPRLQS